MKIWVSILSQLLPQFPPRVSLSLLELDELKLTVCFFVCLFGLVMQLCPTLCNPMDYSPPDSCVHGILQARILEWLAFSFSMGSSRPRDRTLLFHFSCSGRQILYCCTTWEAQQIAFIITIH